MCSDISLAGTCGAWREALLVVMVVLSSVKSNKSKEWTRIVTTTQARSIAKPTSQCVHNLSSMLRNFANLDRAQENKTKMGNLVTILAKSIKTLRLEIYWVIYWNES
eukprot:3405723-Amphidinium_carterae.1